MNAHDHPPDSLSSLALRATLHCLLGCALGEVLGMVAGTVLGWGNGATVALSTALAFVTGFGLTAWPLLAAGLGVRRALLLAFASDAASIAVMELVDNAVMLVLPGAMDAPLASPLFWGSLALSLALSGVAAFPLNRWLIARGRGHAVLHGTPGAHGAPAMHDRHDSHAGHDPNAGHDPHAGHGHHA